METIVVHSRYSRSSKVNLYSNNQLRYKSMNSLIHPVIFLWLSFYPRPWIGNAEPPQESWAFPGQGISLGTKGRGVEKNGM